MLILEANAKGCTVPQAASGRTAALCVAGDARQVCKVARFVPCPHSTAIRVSAHRSPFRSSIVAWIFLPYFIASPPAIRPSRSVKCDGGKAGFHSLFAAQNRQSQYSPRNYLGEESTNTDRWRGIALRLLTNWLPGRDLEHGAAGGGNAHIAPQHALAAA